MEKQIEELEIIYPDKARGVAKFNVPLAHMLISGADFMLLPSRFEPCGLIQLHAMRYGTVVLNPFLYHFDSTFLGILHLLTIMRTIYSSTGAYCCLYWWACRHCQRRLHWFPNGSLQC